jgi:hypothetical protein
LTAPLPPAAVAGRTQKKGCGQEKRGGDEDKQGQLYRLANRSGAQQAQVHSIHAC